MVKEKNNTALVDINITSNYRSQSNAYKNSRIAQFMKIKHIMISTVFDFNSTNCYYRSPIFFTSVSCANARSALVSSCFCRCRDFSIESSFGVMFVTAVDVDCVLNAYDCICKSTTRQWVRTWVVIIVTIRFWWNDGQTQQTSFVLDLKLIIAILKCFEDDFIAQNVDKHQTIKPRTLNW